MRIFFLVTFFYNIVFAHTSIFDMMQNSKEYKSSNTKVIKPIDGASKSPGDTMPQKYITPEQMQSIAPTDEPDIKISNHAIYENVRPNALLLSIARSPKSVYINQIYSLLFRVDTQTNTVFDLNITLNKTPDLKWLNPNVQWLKNGNGLYETRLYFEAMDMNATLNDISLSLYRNGEFIQKGSLVPDMPKLILLNSKNNFSHIVSDDLKIVQYKTTEFDEKSNILTVELDIKNGDLNSFHLDDNNIIKQGVDAIRGTYARQNGYYFAVLDKNITKLSFSYFNLKTLKFKNFDLSVIPKNEQVSTQIDLNPKENQFEIYKDIAAYSLIAIMLLIFLLSKNIASLIIALAISGYVLYGNNQFSSGVLNEGAVIKILPTTNSSVFYVTKKKEKVDVFNSENKYKKVILKDGKIGWTKEENFAKD